MDATTHTNQRLTTIALVLLIILLVLLLVLLIIGIVAGFTMTGGGIIGDGMMNGGMTTACLDMMSNFQRPQ